MVKILNDQMMTTLEAFIYEELPYEAVGLILPNNTILKLQNESTELSGFQIRSQAIKDHLSHHNMEVTKEVLEGTTLWHSHPSGGVGPSRIDMRNKIPHMSHLVITVTGGDMVYSWY